MEDYSDHDGDYDYDGEDGERQEWYDDKAEFNDPVVYQLPDGYGEHGYDDNPGIIRNEGENLDYDRYVDPVSDPYIPPMDADESEEVRQILQSKASHMRNRDDEIRRYPQRVTAMFANPDEDLNNFRRPHRLPGERVAGPPEPLNIHFIDDENFFRYIIGEHRFIRDVFMSAKAFEDAVLQVEVIFERSELVEGNLFVHSEDIATALATIIYRFIWIFNNNYHGVHREFKVQVGFSAIFKKRKPLGDFDWLTFFKESMLTRDGIPIKFSTAAFAFQCTWNTVIDVINNCLDARNVPNMDSTWRYDSLKSATLRLYCYDPAPRAGRGYCEIPPRIANKKACINPNCKSGCFWWSVKIGLILNRENKIDYSHTPKDIQKEVHEVKKGHTKLQRIQNIENKCSDLGILQYFTVENEERLRVPPKDGVESKFDLIQGTLPDDVPLDDKYFDKFCKANPRIMLCVYVENPSGSIPIQLFFEGNNSPANEVIRVLFLGKKGECGHYVCIKNFNKFLCNIDKCKGHKKEWCDQCKTYKMPGTKPCKHLKLKRKFEEVDVYCCEKCMGTFESKDALNLHNHMCLIVDKNYRVVELPDERKYLEFDKKRTNNLTALPTYMVADFESVLQKTKGDDSDNLTKTRVVANHLPCAYGIKIVSIYPELEKFHTYWGTDPDDTMKHFCEDILNISHYVYNYYLKNNPMFMTPADQTLHQIATECYICGVKFNEKEKKYRDHDHATGKYLGAACNACNFKRVQKNCDLPLIFHNAKGYDLHHIIKEITKERYDCTFNGIAQNSEKIMSFTIIKRLNHKADGTTSSAKCMCNIKIIDSLLFLLKSLESLTGILKKRHPDDLPRAFPILFDTMRKLGYIDNQIEATLNKNIYPYLWFDSFDKFKLPMSELIKLVNDEKYEAFTDVVDETYKSTFANKKKKFFDILGCLPGLTKVIHYCDIYLMSDVLQLADIIENARGTFFATHKLDLIRYYGAPGYSWDAYLYFLSNQRLYRPELFISTEMNMVCFFMQCIRGGCSGIMKRYARANNHLIKSNYDPRKPESYILYLDANNLYGWSMMQNLPYRNFKWLSESELNNFNWGGQIVVETFLNTLEAKRMGCFLEVKLDYPQELHDAHNLYPLAPERRCVKESELSYFTRRLHESLNVKINTKTPLLLQTLENKDHYFVYWKNLQLYLQLGMKLSHVYGGITFDEAPIMRDYIMLNTRLRNQPNASEFERELYKLMNNSIYGKTLENPMKYSLLHFISTKKQMDKTIAKPGFDGTVFVQDNFAIAKLKYETVKYDKPLYLGATVTELAKWKMYNFYYNVLQDYFKPPKKCELLFTDTDSLMLQITTDDVYKDIAEINKIPKYMCPIDVSSFDPEKIKQYNINTLNNKQIGAFKSETGSKQIGEFVGLRAKMYSYLVDGEELEKHLKAKGVAKSSLNKISHQNYIDCLFNPDVPTLARQSITMNSIRSKKHNLMSVESEKFGLSCNDTKRYVIPHGPGKFIETLAFGHKDIAEWEKSEIAIAAAASTAAVVNPPPTPPPVVNIPPIAPGIRNKKVKNVL